MIKGLNSSEVEERVNKGLINKTSKSRTKTVGEILIENIFSLFNIIIGGVIIFVIIFFLIYKDYRLLLDSIGILSVAILNTTIAIYQELKAKKALDKVNLLLKRTVTVIRDGKEIKIDQEQIVLDDIIKISRGDQVIVDGTIIYSERLEIDESLLTGESLPIEKEQGDKILSGSFCISGSGLYKAEKIGDESYAQSITNLAKKYKFDLTPLQKRINVFLKFLFLFAIFLVLLKILIGRNINITESDFIREIATILISLIPQGLILTASVTDALGVYRISRIGAIIQKLNAIESFSNVQLVCMDKTGTLTQNKLKVAKLFVINEKYTEEEIKILLGTYAHYTLEKNATSKSLEEYPVSNKLIKIDELPFSSESKFSAINFQEKNENIIYVLGAFDILFEKVIENYKNIIQDVYTKNGINIYRNLLFGKVIGKSNIDDLKGSKFNFQIEPLSVISISDTIRTDVFSAINLFKENGINFKILSGDSSEAIEAIVNDIGWKIDKNKFITGKELRNISDEETFFKVVNEKIIFARLIPEDKLKIIKALKSKNIYTAMIGDGVNDLPAIKEANMGIAMEEGSSITKEVADLILLRNKFSLLPEIFNEGNKIVNSVSLVAKLFLTKNFIVIYFTLLSYLSFMFPLTPRRVSLFNIFAIGLPALILTIRNNNINKCKNFLIDVFSYVVIASFTITISSIIGGEFVKYYLDSSENIISMTMIAIMIFTAVINFLIVSKNTFDKRLKYYLYSIILISIFLFLSLTKINIGLLNIIKLFYEIDTLEYLNLIIIFIVSFFAFILLYILDSIRKYIFKKWIKN
ncbi:MAG: HAD-IC family P-type ATPase [Ignavibacteria bacterium]|nr:HAD-IC family P-type ATPase [Ignavibacteria bacterium]